MNLNEMTTIPDNKDKQATTSAALPQQVSWILSKMVVKLQKAKNITGAIFIIY